MNKLYALLPKVELHCHLDGSVDRETLKKIYAHNNEQLPFSDRELDKLMIAPMKCKDLSEYLNAFPIVTKALRSKEALKLALYSLIKQAEKENLLYLEIRFSPWHLSTDTFSMEEIVDAVLQAWDEISRHTFLEVGFILCMMRGREEVINKEVLSLAKKYKNQGIVGIDLAGNELKYPTIDYRDLFDIACNFQLPFTIHAGETGNWQNIEDAINFGAQRIGHGLACIYNEWTLNAVIEKQVLLELCPICNIQTGAIPSWGKYPIPIFKRRGVRYCINTDNRTVSNTTLANEYQQVLTNVSQLSLSELKKLNVQAMKYSFASKQTIDKVSEQILNYKIE